MITKSRDCPTDKKVNTWADGGTWKHEKGGNAGKRFEDVVDFAQTAADCCSDRIVDQADHAPGHRFRESSSRWCRESFCQNTELPMPEFPDRSPRTFTGRATWNASWNRSLKDVIDGDVKLITLERTSVRIEEQDVDMHDCQITTEIWEVSPRSAHTARAGLVKALQRTCLRWALWLCVAVVLSGQPSVSRGGWTGGHRRKGGMPAPITGET